MPPLIEKQISINSLNISSAMDNKAPSQVLDVVPSTNMVEPSRAFSKLNKLLSTGIVSMTPTARVDGAKTYLDIMLDAVIESNVGKHYVSTREKITIDATDIITNDKIGKVYASVTYTDNDIAKDTFVNDILKISILDVADTAPAKSLYLMEAKNTAGVLEITPASIGYGVYNKDGNLVDFNGDPVASEVQQWYNRAVNKNAGNGLQIKEAVEAREVSVKDDKAQYFLKSPTGQIRGVIKIHDTTKPDTDPIRRLELAMVKDDGSYASYYFDKDGYITTPKGRVLTTSSSVAWETIFAGSTTDYGTTSLLPDSLYHVEVINQGLRYMILMPISGNATMIGACGDQFVECKYYTIVSGVTTRRISVANGSIASIRRIKLIG